jgi:DNA primase catalytic core
VNDFRAVVDAVRDRTDLVSLVGRDVELHQAGSVLKGSSPFRNDADPSFVVWTHSQTWRDFSGASDDGGDCLDYVMARDGVGFWEALHTLADEAGVDVPGREDDQLRNELDKLSERRRLERLLTEAARYYHQVLPSKLRGSWHRDRYGFTDETVDKLLLGWADGHLYEHLVGVVGATEEEALSTGLFVRFRDGRVTDFFQQRLVFPYWRRGRVVYFIARQTELTPEAPWEQAKYKKLHTRSDKHPYVSALVQNDTFYNEDAATRGRVRQLLVTEGVTDCISAMQAGVPCISPVTVRFRKKDLPKLIALTERVSEVVICNDSEDSGAGEAGATETAAALQAEGRIVRISRIPRPEGKD